MTYYNQSFTTPPQWKPSLSSPTGLCLHHSRHHSILAVTIPGHLRCKIQKTKKHMQEKKLCTQHVTCGSGRTNSPPFAPALRWVPQVDKGPMAFRPIGPQRAWMQTTLKVGPAHQSDQNTQPQSGGEWWTSVRMTFFPIFCLLLPPSQITCLRFV